MRHLTIAFHRVWLPGRKLLHRDQCGDDVAVLGLLVVRGAGIDDCVDFGDPIKGNDGFVGEDG